MSPASPGAMVTSVASEGSAEAGCQPLLLPQLTLQGLRCHPARGSRGFGHSGPKRHPWAEPDDPLQQRQELETRNPVDRNSIRTLGVGGRSMRLEPRSWKVRNSLMDPTFFHECGRHVGGVPSEKCGNSAYWEGPLWRAWNPLHFWRLVWGVNGQDFRTRRDPFGRFTLFLISQLVSGSRVSLTQSCAGPAGWKLQGESTGPAITLWENRIHYRIKQVCRTAMPTCF